MSLFNMMTSGGGSGGFEYESGVYTASTGTDRFTAYFSKQHEKPPVFLFVVSTDDYTQSYSDSFIGVFDFYSILGQMWAVDMAGRNTYGYKIEEQSRGTNMSQTSAILQKSRSTSGNPTTTNDLRFWLKEDSIQAYGYFQAGATVLWLALWLPDNWTPPTA